MSRDNRFQQFKAQWRNFLNQNPIAVLDANMSFNDFDGASLDELRVAMRFVVNTVDSIVTSDLYKDLSFQVITQLQGQLTNVHNALSAFITSRDQGNFQALSIQTDAYANQIRQWGLPYLTIGSKHLEQVREKLAEEMRNLTTTKGDVEKLQQEIKTLIEPAVAGSLSKAFTSRRDSLMVGRIVWAVIAIALGAASIVATYTFASTVGDAMKTVGAVSVGANMVWAAAVVRSVVLLPLFAAFGFAFSQYKKERDFEEEYAHKAAVATSLPNYGDLAREQSVRDQIVTGATAVIFTSPTSQISATDLPERTIKNTRQLLKAVAVVLPKR